MITINLRKHYPWYTHDEYIEVPEEVFEAIRAGERQESAYKQRMYYHRAHYSLDVGDGIENDALHPEPTPEQIYDYKFTMQQLCNALNSLPDAQGRRVDAFYLLGMKKVEVAKVEGVNDSSVCLSIKTGLRNMRKYLQNLL